MQLQAKAIVEMTEMLVVVVASPSKMPQTLLVVIFVRLQGILNAISVIKKGIMLVIVTKNSVIAIKHNYTLYNNRLLPSIKPLMALASVVESMEIPL